jgi:hypothetical protein
MFAFERTGGDAGKDYALVVVNSNARKPGTTADGANVMLQVAARGRLCVTRARRASQSKARAWADGG